MKDDVGKRYWCIFLLVTEMVVDNSTISDALGDSSCKLTLGECTPPGVTRLIIGWNG